jgi:hypothetical protein
MAPRKKNSPKKKATSKKKATALVKAKPQDVAVMNMLEEDSGKGFEGVQAEDMGTPFLVMAQPLSPQVTKGNAKYIEGLEAGMVFNNLTEEFWSEDGDCTIVVCHYERCFIEWIPRNQGGGFVSKHDRNSVLVKATPPVEQSDGKTRRVLPNGNELVETVNYNCIVVDKLGDGNHNPVILSMKVIGLKSARKLLQMLDSAKIETSNGFKKSPIYGHYVHVGSVLEPYDEGSAYNWVFTLGEQIADVDLYVAARAFAERSQQQNLFAESVEKQATPSQDSEDTEAY